MSTEKPMNDINELSFNYIVIIYNKYHNGTNFHFGFPLQMLFLTKRTRNVLYIFSKLALGTNDGLSLIISLYIWLDLCRPIIESVCDEHACIFIPSTDNYGIYCFSQNPANKMSEPRFNI